ncbi:aldehyde dehydrogenase family protein [Arthrobacter sp. Z4-13]
MSTTVDSTSSAAAQSVLRAETPDSPDLLEGTELPQAKHFMQGAYRSSSSGTFIDVVNPATGKVFSQVAEGTTDDVDAAVAAAMAAQPAWAARTPKDRSDVLHLLAERVGENAELLARLESTDSGKPLTVSRDDVAQSIDTLRFVAGAVRAGTSAAAEDYVEGHLSVIRREPLGVIAVVTPWNYPLLMAVWKIAPVLASGNTLVLKPSEHTSLSALKLAEVVADLLPAGVLNVVTGYGPVVGQRLSTHPDIALVALTGSVASGKAVAAAAVGSLKRVHLELGGKAPVIVFADADLAQVAAAVRGAGFWNSGQDCGAGCRLLVHESVTDDLVRLLVREVETLVVGEPAVGDNVEIGPLVSEAHFEKVKGFLDRARAAGIPAAIGGESLPGAGFFVAPTVLTQVPDGAECAQQEIFGPVVTVESFTDEDEVVRRANEVEYGLAASVWTENARRSHDIAARLDFGTVWVNSHLVVANEMPWGGFKGSGYGRDLSIYALDDFTRTKHVMHNHTR